MYEPENTDDDAAVLLSDKDLQGALEIVWAFIESTLRKLLLSLGRPKINTLAGSKQRNKSNDKR